MISSHDSFLLKYSSFLHIYSRINSSRCIMARYEDAVEIAAHHVRKKEEKDLKKKKHSHEDHNLIDHQQNCSQGDEEQKSCNFVKLQVEEGKVSTILKSPKANRQFERRAGVAEKNDTERKLVKECVKVVTRANNLNDFNLL